VPRANDTVDSGRAVAAVQHAFGVEQFLGHRSHPAVCQDVLQWRSGEFPAATSAVLAHLRAHRLDLFVGVDVREDGVPLVPELVDVQLCQCLIEQGDLQLSGWPDPPVEPFAIATLFTHVRRGTTQTSFARPSPSNSTCSTPAAV